MMLFYFKNFTLAAKTGNGVLLGRPLFSRIEGTCAFAMSKLKFERHP